MKTIYTTKREKILVSDQDYDWLNQWKWYINSHGYVVRTDYTQGKIYKYRHKPLKIIKMHNLLIELPKGYDRDHIDRNKLNNQRDNLRVVTRSQNAFNRGKNKNNTTGIKNIYFHKWGNIKRRWLVKIGQHNIGYFLTKEEAIKVLKNYQGGVSY